MEEITLTYVVIHVWDDTRLVLPLSYFIEEPFQNWTRSSAQLLGQVHVWVDYTFPVDEGRKALKEIIETNPMWDRRFWNLQVVEADEKAMQLRVLATAADSSTAWNLAATSARSSSPSSTLPSGGTAAGACATQQRLGSRRERGGRPELPVDSPFLTLKMHGSSWTWTRRLHKVRPDPDH